MNQTMYNLFTTDDLDGIITAAYYHAIARHMKSGLHVCFCRDNLSQKVKALQSTIALAHAGGFKLPDVRFIILAGVDTTPDTDAMLNMLDQQEWTVCITREPHMEVSPIERVLFQTFICVYSLFIGRDEAMYKLSDFLFNRLYSNFKTGRD